MPAEESLRMWFCKKLTMQGNQRTKVWLIMIDKYIYNVYNILIYWCIDMNINCTFQAEWHRSSHRPVDHRLWQRQAAHHQHQAGRWEKLSKLRRMRRKKHTLQDTLQVKSYLTMLTSLCTKMYKIRVYVLSVMMWLNRFHIKTEKIQTCWNMFHIWNIMKPAGKKM